MLLPKQLPPQSRVLLDPYLDLLVILFDLRDSSYIFPFINPQINNAANINAPKAVVCFIRLSFSSDEGGCFSLHFINKIYSSYYFLQTKPHKMWGF